MPNSGWSGFVPKMTLGALGILFTLLVGYFIWLGTTLVTVKNKVANIEIQVISLNESRQAGTEQLSHENSQRITQLEEKRAVK